MSKNIKNPRKFFVNTFIIKVLSEDEPVGDVSLEDLHYMTMDDNCVLYSNTQSCKKLNSKQIVNKLNEAGSEPGFFMLDNDGKDIE